MYFFKHLSYLNTTPPDPLSSEDKVGLVRHLHIGPGHAQQAFLQSDQLYCLILTHTLTHWKLNINYE